MAEDPTRSEETSKQIAPVRAVSRLSTEVLGDAPAVPGYEVGRLLGAGGMGAVYEALEYRFDRRVALKVSLNSVKNTSFDLFQEARIAAQVDDPGFVHIYDYGFTLDSRPFFAMEYVEGHDLYTHLQEGPLTSARALRIALDIARAAAAAHERGIVHRDLKPRNVMLDSSERARVLDFGIAVHQRDTESADVAGSVPYMAPEQLLKKPYGPPADVYSIGLILFEMLTGRRPFVADNPVSFLYFATSEPAPPVSEFASAVHADLETIVARCLRKDPSERYRSGRELVDVLLAVTEGRSLPKMPSIVAADLSSSGANPPPDVSRATRHFRRAWSFKSSPEALWPHLSNTDRVNRAAGLQPVVATGTPNAENGLSREGSLEVFGVGVEWQEFPFEWIQNRDHRVHRLYKNGPLQALWNHVALLPREGGGTDVVHTISLVPRGALGEIAALLEIGQRTMRALARVYERVDAILQSGSGQDPFEEGHDPDRDQVAFVDGHMATLTRRGFDPQFTKPLRDLLLFAPSPTIARLRPLQLAKEWGTDSALTLEMFMMARDVGLVQHAWDIVCPSCRVPHECVAELAQVNRAGECAGCGIKFERDLAESLELIFRPAPPVRVTALTMYCMGSPAARAHVIFQQVLAPGETRQVHVQFQTGSLDFCASSSSGRSPLAVTASAFASSVELTVRGKSVLTSPAVVRTGPCTVTLRNETSEVAAFRLELPTGETGAYPASQALLHPKFESVSARERIIAKDYISVAEQAYLCLEITNVDSLLLREGDPSTLARLERVEEAFRAAVGKQAGSLFSRAFTAGLLVAGFPGTVAALAAAVRCFRTLPDSMRASVHAGPALAFTRGNSIEYFGKTIQEGIQLLREVEDRTLALAPALLGKREPLMFLTGEGLKMQIAMTKAQPATRLGIVQMH